ncbi:facilitated trehalose transporter Tret1-like [Contarinia nasturtii]|uniref:facilitated trehalose transporter Tret1-like n=1 Tax=Contarinia nasturtii TaxID=265458 RepID=UPI0012D4C358|nr:facilitated trehalose transporter Tret1-like [Contarinia nasturtii]
MSEEVKSDTVFSDVKRQIWATLVVNCIILSHGCAVGFFSPALLILRSEKTPIITGPLTNAQSSWIGSMSSVGSVLGTFICGFLSALFGCKKAMIFLAFPTTIFWLLIHFGDTFYKILIARLIGGITGGGMQAGVALFVSEISNDNMRGRLGAFTPLARNIGVMLSFIAGAIVEYQYWPYIFIFIPIIYLILLLLLPNTPQHYIEREEFHKAKRALIYYKGCEENNERQRTLLNSEFEQLKAVIEERKKSAKLEMKDFCNRPVLKGIFFSIAMSWFLQTTGCFIITNYASLIFEQSGTALGINVSSIVLAIVQIFGGLVSTKMGDAFGRKITLFISLYGSIVGLLIFAVYMYFRQNGYDVSNYVWIPIISSSLIIFVSSAGIMALSNTCTIENFPPKIRTAGVVFYSLCNNAVAFIGDKYFPILLEIIFLHGFLLFLAFNCVIGLFFIAFMKETRGNSLERP